MNVPGVLLSTANLHLAYLIATDLSRRGVRVEVTADCPASPIRLSPHVSRFHLTPPVASGEPYVDAVCDILRKRGLPLFLPSCREVFELAPYRDRLQAQTVYPFERQELVERVNHKGRLAVDALRAGILVPNWMPWERSTVRSADELRYPVVCKPATSFGAKGFQLAENPGQLLRQAAELPAATSWLLQEFIPGPLMVWMGVRWQGRLRASFAFETLKTTPAFGGASVLRRSIVDPELDDLSNRLLAFLGYNGFCTLDYIRHRHTGQLYLIDFNPRFGTSLHAAMVAGVSFPECLLKLAMGEFDSPPPYAEGVMSSSLAGHLGRIFRSCPRKPPRGALINDALRAFAQPGFAEECYSRTPVFALLPLLQWLARATPRLGIYSKTYAPEEASPVTHR